ncbi:hypothetical protein [Neobacillus sp. CF12]|uniref:hypothetical protein n=1 Tax=Neobacillus sp. CF12 TaxID=3055864 RepID=UPI0025A0A074|nr:hypothetical protein [Neobacillus sp. CF12]MDM5330337.1 hypothetical protein [Neobacillus sp. CF12]
MGKNREKIEKECDCCCVEGIRKVLEKLRDEPTIFISTCGGSLVEGRIKNLTCDIVMVVRQVGDNITEQWVSLCEIDRIFRNTTIPAPTDDPNPADAEDFN